MASPTAILSILIRRNPDAEAGLSRFNAALDATATRVPEDLVARGARTFDRSLLAQQDEVTKRNHARAVLRAASEAGWVSKDDCDLTHEADMAYIRDADAARDEARAQVERLRADREHYRMDGNRQFQAARDARAQADALADALREISHVEFRTTQDMHDFANAALADFRRVTQQARQDD